MPLSKPAEGVLPPNGAVREMRQEPVFSRYEVYEDKMREVYRHKGLLAFAAVAREYVKIL